MQRQLWIASSAGFASRVKLTSSASSLNPCLRRQPSTGLTRAPAAALWCSTSAPIPSNMNVAAREVRTADDLKQQRVCQCRSCGLTFIVNSTSRRKYFNRRHKDNAHAYRRKLRLAGVVA